MSYKHYPTKRPLNTMELNNLMDRSFKAGGMLEFKIEQSGPRKKLIATNEDYGFRSFAYFTHCVEPAKQAIKMQFAEVLDNEKQD